MAWTILVKLHLSRDKLNAPYFYLISSFRRFFRDSLQQLVKLELNWNGLKNASFCEGLPGSEIVLTSLRY